MDTQPFVSEDVSPVEMDLVDLTETAKVLFKEVLYAPNYQEDSPIFKLSTEGKIGTSVNLILDKSTDIIGKVHSHTIITESQVEGQREEVVFGFQVIFNCAKAEGHPEANALIEASRPFLQMLTQNPRNYNTSGVRQVLTIKLDEKGSPVIEILSEGHKITKGVWDDNYYSRNMLTINSDDEITFEGQDQDLDLKKQFMQELQRLAKSRLIQLCALFGIDPVCAAKA